MTAFFVSISVDFGGFRGICVNQIGYEYLSIRCFLLIKETIQWQTIKECNLHSFMSSKIDLVFFAMVEFLCCQ